MPKTVLYRGDTRKPEVVKRDGFALHGGGAAGVRAAGGTLQYLKNTLKGTNPQDIQRWIINGRNWDRPTVSTAYDPGCGGYDGDYIYVIEFANLYEVALSRGSTIRGTLGIMEQRGEPELFLLMDNMILEHSRMIAIGLNVGTKEVSFFTDIPSANITWYRTKNQVKFSLMRDVEPAPAQVGRLNLQAFAKWQSR